MGNSQNYSTAFTSQDPYSEVTEKQLILKTHRGKARLLELNSKEQLAVPSTLGDMQQ